MESPRPIIPQPKISHNQHNNIRYFISHSIYSLMSTLCNFIQERNTFCFNLSDINVLHNIKRCVSEFFIKWNSILRKTTQNKIKLTKRSSKRRHWFIIIQNSIHILNSTHSEVDIPLPYSQYSYFQFFFFTRTGFH